MSRIIVRGLPKYLTEARLREHFGKVVEVTDAKIMKTKDGKSRQFGFVGFKTQQEAHKALKSLHNTFLDTSKISVELAKAVGDPSLGRAWSKYTPGSSAYAKMHPSQAPLSMEIGQGNAKARLSTLAAKKGVPGSASTVAKNASPETNDEALRRFLSVMGGSKKGPIWSNEDTSLASISASSSSAQPPAKKRKAVGSDGSEKVVVTSVESKRNGQKGHFLERKHKKFGGVEDAVEEEGDASSSDDEEYQDFDEVARASAIAAAGEQEGEFEDMEDEEMVDEEEEAKVEKVEEEDQDIVAATAAAARAKQQAMGTQQSDDPTAAWEEGRLFVRNLAYTVTEQDLQKLFKKYGKISEVHIPIDKETKKPKGIAFILFLIPEDAVKAFSELDGTTFQGRLLHILPAKAAPVSVRPDSTKKTAQNQFKNAKGDAQKARAQNPFNWNSLFLRQDAVASSISKKLDVGKSDLLDHDSSNLAVRMALAEAHTIAETKKFLEDEGANIALLEPPSDQTEAIERSSTTIIVKNLPSGTRADELQALFGQHGTVVRMCMPPSCVIAVVEFGQPSEARAAFKGLAYRKYRHVPLFLEWAPQGLFPESAPIKLPEKREETEEEKSAKKEEEENEETKRCTVYVKNLNFATVEESIKALFERAGRVRAVTIPRRKDPKGQSSPMGFGFVEFFTHDSAVAAVRTLQSSLLDGHALDLSLAKLKKATDEAPESKNHHRHEEKNKRRREETVTETAKSTKLAIRNVPFEATKREIRELFSTFAQVKSVRLPRRADGHHRGFAFVEFLTKQEAAAAVEALKTAHLYGRHLIVEYADENDPFSQLKAGETDD